MSSSTKSCNQNAERFKAQGNEFHQKGQYQAAYRKYTDAIKEDPTNAIYYANRAASSLGLKERRNLILNTLKLGQGSELLLFVNAWTTALACLPSESQSTETDKKLRVQFTEGLRKAERASNTPVDQGQMMYGKMDEMPWNKAIALEQELVDAKEISSALVDLTNGLMRDPRAFNFDSTDWIDRYNKQVIFEAEVFKAWVHGGAKTVKQEALQRLKREGWDPVRNALATTVRAWLMCGFLAASTGRRLVAMEYYSRAIDVLDWGRQVWQNVSVEDRGVIFEKTFVRGAKRLRLSAMYECLASKMNDLPFTMEEVADLSRDLIAETEANLPNPDDQFDVGFLASFWMYPKGEALSILGWYHMQLGLAADNAEDANTEFAESAKYYIQAAESYPMDEESVLIFFKVALEAYWFQPEGKKLKDMLPLVMRIRMLLPKVMRFWEKSASSNIRDLQIQQALSFATDCEKAMKEGKISLDDVVKPKSIKRQDKWGKEVIYV
ncbi:hypothetical protein BDZ97DRAFT_1906614 [Flammula alnicola]|nr:hypothetical protein BDZ97DRAFT_1906614 [Flammula alnicola]